MKRKPDVYLPPVVRASCPRAPVFKAPRGSIAPPWRIIAIRHCAGHPLPPLVTVLDVAATMPVDVLAGVPSWTTRIDFAADIPPYGFRRFAVVSPVLLVDDEKHDPAKGWFSIHHNRIIIGG